MFPKVFFFNFLSLIWFLKCLYILWISLLPFIFCLCSLLKNIRFRKISPLEHRTINRLQKEVIKPQEMVTRPEEAVSQPSQQVTPVTGGWSLGLVRRSPNFNRPITGVIPPQLSVHPATRGGQPTTEGRVPQDTR